MYVFLPPQTPSSAACALTFPPDLQICSTMVLTDIISDVFVFLPPIFHVHTPHDTHAHKFILSLFIYYFIISYPSNAHPITPTHTHTHAHTHTHTHTWPYMATFDFVCLLHLYSDQVVSIP